MANHHFGEIGDVWKHLPLAELIALERPRQYWESHAGSALYPLSHSWQREYGVYYLLDHVHRRPTLEASRYHATLTGLKSVGGYPTVYPGSAMLAMLLLAREAQEYVLCDLDPESIASLQNAARSTSTADRVRCVHDDGIATLWEKGSTLTAREASQTMVHIDPFDPFDASGRYELSAVDLCCRLAKCGCKVIYWYGLETFDERGWAWRLISPRLAGDTTPLWCGEVSLVALQEPDLPPNPGIRGCGVLCANISRVATEVCARLGTELAAIYQDASLPQGRSGALEFRQWSVG